MGKMISPKPIIALNREICLYLLISSVEIRASCIVLCFSRHSLCIPFSRGLSGVSHLFPSEKATLQIEVSVIRSFLTIRISSYFCLDANNRFIVSLFVVFHEYSIVLSFTSLKDDTGRT